MRFGIPSHSFSHVRSCGSKQSRLKPLIASNLWKKIIRNVGNVPNISDTRAELIRKHTVISRDHLTPEIQLHLITPECKLWSEDQRSSPFEDPFWAFYWPGGQALARYILDNPLEVKGKTVVDIGCGSGACAIAAALSKARSVTANDTDEFACIATMLNARLNQINLTIESSNVIGQSIPWDCILVGDMFYDDEFAAVLFSWLSNLRSKGKRILIGDAGRLALRKLCTREHLTSCAEIHLPDNVRAENNGFTTAHVWSLGI